MASLINPYLNFNGNCKAAFEFYKSVFGGEFAMISQFKDMPPSEEHVVSANEADLILHVALPIGQGTVLMGSDCPPVMGKVTFGNNIAISINTESEEETTKIFNALSAGGKVTMPLGKTFWNAYFGMCADKFGIPWMVNYDYSQQK